MTITEPTRVPQLGAALQRARKMRQLTLDQLAQRSGVSKSMLSQIERGKANPTFVILWNLTQALGVDIGALVDQVTPRAPKREIIDHVKAYSTPVIKSADGLCELKILSPPHTILPVEWYEMRVQPAGVLRSERHAEGTYEHLTCLDGELVVRIGDWTLTVAEGETVRYGADQTREVENTGTETVRALLVVALPAQYGKGA
jgi:transcriptional regulator with XRE-family HTH domain